MSLQIFLCFNNLSTECKITKKRNIMNKITIDDATYPILDLPGRPKALLDRIVADIFQVETKYLNRIISRNRKKFPSDFYFELTDEEVGFLKNYTVNSTSRAFNRTNPKALSWEGCNMLAMIIRSDVAIERSIQIIRAFSTPKTLENIPTQDISKIIALAVAGDRNLIKALVNEIDTIKVGISSMQSRLHSIEEIFPEICNQITELDEIINSKEAGTLRKIVSKKAQTRKQTYNIWQKFKQKFSISKYTNLPKNRFSEAIKWLEKFEFSTS